MSSTGYDIVQVAAQTGLEESLIRYYEATYAPLFPPKIPAGAELHFDTQVVPLLRDIHRHCSAAGRALDLSALQRLLTPTVSEVSTQPRKPGVTITVTSGKGGVGKSSVALNLGVLFRQANQRVLLFDADLGTGNLHILAGIKRGPTLLDCVRCGAAVQDVICPGPLGMGLVAGGSGIAELAALPDAVRHNFLTQLRHLTCAVDRLVIDTGTGIGPAVVEFATAADFLVVVSTPDITAITDAYGIIKAVSRIAPTKPIGVVVNQTPSAALAIEVFHRIEQCAARFTDMALTYLGPVYRDPAVGRAVAHRKPFVLDAPDASASRSLRRVVQNLENRIHHTLDRQEVMGTPVTHRGTGTDRFGNAIPISL